MCNFRIDFAALRDEVGNFVSRLMPSCEASVARFSKAVDWSAAAFVIRPDARALTRLIACEFHAYSDEDARHSLAT